MPERLPLFLILRQFSRQLASAVLFGLRAVLVASIWLAALPWVTIWTWRMYFAMGNHAAWWISALKRPEHEPDLFDDIPANATATNTTSPATPTPHHHGILTHPVVLQVSSDIVAGQIIASMIVIAFVAIFLLREWITQNARPGIFEDGDVPAEEDAPEAVPPAPEVAPPAIVVQEAPPVPVRPMVVNNEAPRNKLPDGRVRYDGVHREDVARARAKKQRTRSDATAPTDTLEAGPSRHTRPRSRGHTPGRETTKGKGRRSSRAAEKARLRAPPPQADEDSEEDRYTRALKTKEFRRLEIMRNMYPLEYGQSTPGPSEGDEGADPEEWSAGRKHDRSTNALPTFAEFTFTVPPASASSLHTDAPSSSENGTAPHRGSGYGEPPTRNPFASPSPPLHDSSSTEEDERELTPKSANASLPGPSDQVALRLDTQFPGVSVRVQTSPSPSPSTPSGLRRPPLPTMTLPPSPALASASASAAQSRKQTPLASPSLATYRAPEDLDALVPDGQVDYFVEQWYADLMDANDLEEAHRKYFRDPEDRQRELEEAEAERAERAEMADVELDGDMDDDADDVRWTDEEVVAEVEEEEEEEEEGPGLEDDVHEDDADQPEEVEDDALPEAGAVQRAEPPPPIPEDFENDINIEDDMDGALEAIGLRGPLYGVLQNAILMTFILDTTIGLGIWLPFTIGKTTALLSLNPRRAMQILHLPLRAIRIVTDPIVDTVLLVVSRLLVAPLAVLTQLAMTRALGVLASFAGPERAEKFVDVVITVYSRVMDVATKVMDSAAISTPSEAAKAEPTSYLYRLLEEDTAVMRVAEPYFAPLGQSVRQWSEQGKETWVEMATGDDRQDRVFAVSLGYAVVGLLLAIYLNILTVGTMRSAGRAVRSAIRQQLLVVKVAAFIVIELIIFPLGCGMMLDVCSVWMFPHGTFRSRAAFLLFAPLRATFYHWVLGTMFMYQFAVLLSGCRGIMRPGAMWFIKDPQDQNFHPIRDILERPTFVQLRKLLLSAAMYGVVVASGVATVSGILRLFRGTIMPFRWKIREPLSEVPIDLIFIQLVLPYTMEYFRPRKALRKLGTSIWKYLARQLRLSSYMFGGRFPSEEYTSEHWSWRSLLSDDGIQMDDAEAVHDGTFRRVPNSDNVALVKDAPATVQVDEEGHPVDAHGSRLIIAQNLEAEKAKRIVKEDYTVVYIPPQFRYRVITFLLCIWTVGSALLAAVLAAPILLGRGVFRLFLPYDVHDGYAFILGFYLLWGCWLVGTALDRMDKRRQRRWSDGARADWSLFVLKRGLLWIAQASYMLGALGVVIPTLLGVVVELYIIQPIKHAANPLGEPRIRMVDMWALGLLYLKIIVRSMRVHQPGHDQMRGVDRLIRNGLAHLDPMRATTEVIAPACAGLLGMIVFPAASLWATSRLVTLPMDGDFLFVHVYPGIFTLAGLGHGAWVLSKVTRSWSQTIRDKEFLVEMRLRNLEEQEAADNAAKADAQQVAAAAAVVVAADAEGHGDGDGDGDGEGED
ncbi:ERAD-associated E3 ubiquitin-protein ligase doa10 [Trametes pubescens]|uniref:RING-type E3 ubiquitin transferase n=1 Tax=Trametes pubescens TaxID=154538 RepID=A0A1M2V6V7_TRAPU|nr:ERAD-associated E3 ubiquitin-protein ligase doa10 [Trametes pubescens]